MDVFKHSLDFLIRFRYPVSLPEEVGEALGLSLSNFLSFSEMFAQLISTAAPPTKLFKMMGREEAESSFGKARKKEKFSNSSLFSYYFNDSWLEFSLEFDETQALRRIYLQHKSLKEPYEIPLPAPSKWIRVAEMRSGRL